ncbi:hypothetical protein CC86DRAFT_467054 [Ophiobolus disseminans]|uniref:F-box domain-containing protein n=1 Tax=Ophiobolus disseminans TaxID=1469910 RepID=A0A6A6ZZN6_9PLEO|nr:hypothetical protein CC86DRAFT_467054 [Ophiobolus disseminans]
MPTITDLPGELLDSICGDLSRSDILSLRHASRQMVHNLRFNFEEQFDSIHATCSKAGLKRLGQLTLLPRDRRHTLDRITHVTIHVLTDYRLRELAQSFAKSVGHPYFWAYSRTRRVLVHVLNTFPNLKAITITNEIFERNPEPAPGSFELSAHRDPLDDEYPTLRAFESALSIMPSLKKKDLELRMVIEYSTQKRDQKIYQGQPFLLDCAMTLDTWENGFFPSQPKVQSHIFGNANFSAGKVIEKYLKHLTLRHYERYLDTEPGDIMRAVLAAPLTHLTLDDASLESTKNMFWEPYGAHFSALTHLRIRDSEVSPRFAEWLCYQVNSLQVVELWRCMATRIAKGEVLGRFRESLVGRKCVARECWVGGEEEE